MIRQFELVERIKAYDPAADEELINRAYVFAMKAHGAQVRASGDPYFSHPLEVAGILTDFKLDTDTIVTALLHDTIEDTDTTLNDIEPLFGNSVAKLVDGVTKLTRIEFQSDHAKQAENFRKFVLAMSEDIRVLLIKLSDRLHNMRTLHYIKNRGKRQRIARETMDIYAPLAERIGIQEMKQELEDLSFTELNWDARQSILNRLKFLRSKGEDLIGRIIKELETVLKQQHIEADITGREKTPYSIWRKMQKNEVGFEQLSDIMAFRVIVNSVEDCYKTLGVAHNAYPVVPGRFKDYISTPKPNGYCSLHTGVFGPERHRIELQIRTQHMHQVAEYGVAAHWNYKEGQPDKDGPRYRWLRELLEILEHAAGPEEFLEHTKLEMFSDQVFSFTPRGDLINLPQRATPIDFAYAVHSEVGDRCAGAKINGRVMPLHTQLVNGDQVEIITSKDQTPSPTWEHYAITGKARARIRRFIRLKEKEEYKKLGKSILERTFTDANQVLNDKDLLDVLRTFQQNSVEDLYTQVGNGSLTGHEILAAIYPTDKKFRRKTLVENVISFAQARRRKPKKDGITSAVSIKGLIPGMALHMSGCCHPLPGDRIIGIVTIGRGINVHTIDCDMLESFSDMPERWLDLSWELGEGLPTLHVGRITVSVPNVPGSLGDLSTVIAKNGGNISNLKIVSRSEDFFDMIIDIEVKDVKHLTDVIAALRASPAINTVERAQG
ncbi:MAG: bifunctional (p)ppGpp synthetase/guanosine-3',5'-bis(diphosphate) 3'-pyrophosphohydrolase [Magnetovibrio sp.]|nr:bifunctional (p)ppGpp synthetase/guanosine-3',5'-bis(diphosphate) 3'-pyrophosphohydrolase [Magnetovibrio sp.]